jgi:hypothetical protein
MTSRSLLRPRVQGRVRAPCPYEELARIVILRRAALGFEFGWASTPSVSWLCCRAVSFTTAGASARLGLPGDVKLGRRFDDMELIVRASPLNPAASQMRSGRVQGRSSSLAWSSPSRVLGWARVGRRGASGRFSAVQRHSVCGHTVCCHEPPLAPIQAGVSGFAVKDHRHIAGNLASLKLGEGCLDQLIVHGIQRKTLV